MIAAFMAVNTYLIDAFTLYAASAIAANTILRSVRIIQSPARLGSVTDKLLFRTLGLGSRVSSLRLADVQCSRTCEFFLVCMG